MTLSFASLALLVTAPILFYKEVVSLEMNKILMNIATGIWSFNALLTISKQ